MVNKKFENDLKDKNNLTSGIKFNLEHENYIFETGFTAYENLQKKLVIDINMYFLISTFRIICFPMQKVG